DYKVTGVQTCALPIYSRIEQQVRPQHPADRARGANHWHNRVRAQERLRRRRRDSAQQIEDDEFSMAHRVFDVVSEDPEKQHVAEIGRASCRERGEMTW